MSITAARLMWPLRHAPRPQQKRNSHANQPESGRTRAAFTMQAEAAPTKLKPTQESATRWSHTRCIHNASDGGLKKIENANQLKDGRTHATFTMQAVSAAKQLKYKRKSDRRRSHRAAFTMQAVAAPTKSKPKCTSDAPHSQCKRWRPQQN